MKVIAAEVVAAIEAEVEVAAEAVVEDKNGMRTRKRRRDCFVARSDRPCSEESSSP